MYVCLYMSACVCVDSCVKRYKQAISMPCSSMPSSRIVINRHREALLCNPCAFLVWGSEHMCIIRLIRSTLVRLIRRIINKDIYDFIYYQVLHFGSVCCPQVSRHVAWVADWLAQRSPVAWVAI